MYSVISRAIKSALAYLELTWLSCKVAWYESEDKYLARQINKQRRILTGIQIREARSRWKPHNRKGWPG